MVYNYSIAKDHLNDGEKDRLVCIMLSTADGVIDWPKATEHFGAASVNSMRVSYNNILKKLDGLGAKDDSAPSAVPATPKSGGKRKKATAEGEEGAGAEETPAKKKRGGGRKKKVEENDDEEGKESVKAEDAVKDEDA